jgi:glycosyltransferase involved in cell wall biosynthesis
MKIWLIAHIAPDSRGGVARSMHSLAEGLRQRGHIISLFYASPLTKSNYLLFAIAITFKYLMSLINPPDVIIARSTDGAGAFALVRLLKRKTHCILHSHGWEEHAYTFEQRLSSTCITSPTTYKSRLIRFPLLRATLALSHTCISGTLYEARWIKEHYPERSHKSNYIGNGTDTLKHSALVERDLSMPHFLTVGGRTWKKNIELSLSIFAAIHTRIPAARLTVIGTQQHSTDPLLPSNSITYLPVVEPSDMAYWFQQCPFLIAPSRYEGGHPFTILEAMAHGCIVFASSCFSHREIIRDTINGFCNIDENAAVSAMHIQYIFKDTASLKIISSRAHMTALHHRWSRQLDRLEKLLCQNH